MEASSLQHREPLAVARRLRYLRPLWLQSDEGLVALVRAGSGEAYEELVRRYQTRLLTFCRQILKVETDAEDVLQEVFTAAFYAMRADERPLDLKPWFYRIARNRCLNHIRAEAGMRALAEGAGNHSEEALEVQGADGGFSAADRAFRKQELRQLVQDVLSLSESQRSALVLREMHGLSYEQVAEAMSTSVPSVKSLLVRARGSMLEIAEARELTCDEARDALAEDAEGLGRPRAAVRSHVKRCSSCAAARKRLKATNKALAAVTPFLPLATLKAVLFAKTSPAAGTVASASLSGVSGSAAVGASAGGGVLAVAAKTVVGLSTVVALAGGMSVADREWRGGGSAGATPPAQTEARIPMLPVAAAPTAAAPGGVARDAGVGAQARGPLAGQLPPPSAPGEIESPSREVAPAVIETEPSRALPLSERLPATSVRGRPAPEDETKYRTRPAPPGSTGEVQTDTQSTPPPAESEPTMEAAPPRAEEPAAPAGEQPASAEGQPAP